MDPSGSDYKMIVTYLENSKGPTHSNYRLSVEEAFTVCREGEAERFQAKSASIGNHQLLWHGSRLTNFMGILSQGLRIAPPEAPVTGYMFGKGVYFANCVSKSANYCFTNVNNPRGIMLLCEVALGQTNDLLRAKYDAHLLPPGASSTKGLGSNAPDPAGNITIENGTITVPLGKVTKTPVAGNALLYDEFIVYDVAQIKIKYLLRVKFDY